MNLRQAAVPITAVSVLAVAGCTNLPTRVHDPGVRIELVTSEQGTIRTAGFWRDKNGLSLRGDLSPDGRNRLPDTEHIDIAILNPGGRNAVCVIAPLLIDGRHGGSVFSRRFATLPPTGSLVRLKRHVSDPHSGCAS